MINWLYSVAFYFIVLLIAGVIIYNRYRKGNK